MLGYIKFSNPPKIIMVQLCSPNVNLINCFYFKNGHQDFEFVFATLFFQKFKRLL